VGVDVGGSTYGRLATSWAEGSRDERGLVVSEVKKITDDVGARGLAERLNGDERQRPTVVVTTPAGRSAPFIDAEMIAEELGDLGEVYLTVTGPHTWAFSRGMADNTQVYGGAGRAYPLGHEWIHDLRRSPLRFAFDEHQGRLATDELIADALGMAASAGLLDQPATRAQRRRATGVVKGFPHPDRALVDIDRTLVTVIPELVIAGIPLDRMLTKGMTVEGWFDPTGLRLDLRDSLLTPAESLASYDVGDVVLARVADVGRDSARLELHPMVEITVTHDDVTPNDLDSLDSLMSPGEVVSARVTSTGPEWRLYLADVDDDEPLAPAVALLADGPSWLEPPAEPERLPVGMPPVEPEAVVALIDLVQPADVAEVLAPAPEPTPAAPPAPPRPTPALFDRHRPRPTAPEPAPAVADPEPDARSATNQLRLTVDSLRAELRTTQVRVEQLESEHAALLNERTTLTQLHADQHRDLVRAQDELARLRTRLRRASKTPARGPRAVPEFADCDRGFRYAVETAWAQRTPVGEQAASPLPHFRIGPEFLASVDGLAGISIEKIADVVFEIVTGRADHSTGRDLHQLRESETGNAPYVRRPADGATCWRAALQRGTPQARRLHFWRLANGEVELSRVVKHDDMHP
jgi:hypothetical protein